MAKLQPGTFSYAPESYSLTAIVRCAAYVGKLELLNNAARSSNPLIYEETHSLSQR